MTRPAMTSTTASRARTAGPAAGSPSWTGAYRTEGRQPVVQERPTFYRASAPARCSRREARPQAPAGPVRGMATGPNTLLSSVFCRRARALLWIPMARKSSPTVALRVARRAPEMRPPKGPRSPSPRAAADVHGNPKNDLRNRPRRMPGGRRPDCAPASASNPFASRVEHAPWVSHCGAPRLPSPRARGGLSGRGDREAARLPSPRAGGSCRLQACGRGAWTACVRRAQPPSCCGIEVPPACRPVGLRLPVYRKRSMRALICRERPSPGRIPSPCESA